MDLNELLYTRIFIPGWRDEETVDPSALDSELESQLEVYRKLALNTGGQNNVTHTGGDMGYEWLRNIRRNSTAIPRGFG
jgi:hypothetical protein